MAPSAPHSVYWPFPYPSRVYYAHSSASRTPAWLVPLSRTALPQSFACSLVSLLSFRGQLRHQDTLITLGNSALFVNLWVHLLDGKHYEKGTVLFSVVPRTLPDAWETFNKYTFIEWINE